MEKLKQYLVPMVWLLIVIVLVQAYFAHNYDAFWRGVEIIFTYIVVVELFGKRKEDESLGK